MSLQVRSSRLLGSITHFCYSQLSCLWKRHYVPDLLCITFQQELLYVVHTYSVAHPVAQATQAAVAMAVLLRLLPGLPKGRSASMLIYHMFAHKQL
jgi:hypothetical protein